ncbi:MAG: hypothetical protein M0R34_00425 [Candidatus Marinimicrobia bacterium]|jgi:hypothetical protein|nr:hypothetical protein [Candidatus Neomarinimicrobiota bacterium]
MAKSAFEKWEKKIGHIALYGRNRDEYLFNEGRETGQLESLQGALSKCQATKLAGDYYLTRVISEETIEAEIKRIKGS